MLVFPCEVKWFRGDIAGRVDVDLMECENGVRCILRVVNGFIILAELNDARSMSMLANVGDDVEFHDG